MLQTSNTKKQWLNRKPKKEKQIRASSLRVDESQQEDFYVWSPPTHAPVSVILPSETLTNSKVYSAVWGAVESHKQLKLLLLHFPGHTHANIDIHTHLFSSYAEWHATTKLHRQTTRTGRVQQLETAAADVPSHHVCFCEKTKPSLTCSRQVLKRTDLLKTTDSQTQYLKWHLFIYLLWKMLWSPFRAKSWTKHFQILFLSLVLLQSSFSSGTLVGFLHHLPASGPFTAFYRTRLWLSHNQSLVDPLVRLGSLSCCMIQFLLSTHLTW